MVGSQLSGRLWSPSTKVLSIEPTRGRSMHVLLPWPETIFYRSTLEPTNLLHRYLDPVGFSFCMLLPGEVHSVWLFVTHKRLRSPITGMGWGPHFREAQEASRTTIGIYLPESLNSFYIPTVFLGFPVWGPNPLR